MINQNQQPIVGVLCMDVAAKIHEIYGTSITSYISDSYVQFIERSGGRVAPIWIGKCEDYYEDIMKKINGILLPGGAVHYDSKDNSAEWQTNDYVRSVQLIYRIACSMNEQGVYFPLLGICLGYEMMMCYSTGGSDLRGEFKLLHQMMPLDMEDGFRESKMFKNIPREVEDLMRTKAFGCHYHKYYIIKDAVPEGWKVTSLNRAEDLEFVSTIEHERYPFFGLQFHPERNSADNYTEHLDIENECTKCGSYFADFFVSECRKNPNKIPNSLEVPYLIQNFPVHQTGIKNETLAKCYLFQKDPEYPLICTTENRREEKVPNDLNADMIYTQSETGTS